MLEIDYSIKRYELKRLLLNPGINELVIETLSSSELQNSKNILVFSFSNDDLEEESGLTLFEAENTPCKLANIVSDPEASEGKAICPITAPKKTALLKGIDDPYLPLLWTTPVLLPEGHYEVSFRMKALIKNKQETIARLMIANWENGERLVIKDIRPDSFGSKSTYREIPLHFKADGKSRYNFRVFPRDNKKLWVDRITLKVLSKI